MDMSKELDQIASRIRIDPTELSEREKRIIALQEQGMKLPEVAKELGLAYITVKKINAQINQKTTVLDRLKGGN